MLFKKEIFPLVLLIFLSSCKKDGGIFDKKVPGEVQNILFEDDTTKATLIWTDPTNIDLSEIEITYSNVKIVIPKGVQKATISNLELGTKYQFTIRTIDKKGHKSKGVEISGMLDYRNRVIGDYIGIGIHTYWAGSFIHDTAHYAKLNLSKSSLDSIVCLTINSTEDSHYKLRKDTFICTSLSGHFPTLKLSNDTLYYHYQAGNGPNWHDYIVKKKN
jgi:hypothetical protein